MGLLVRYGNVKISILRAMGNRFRRLPQFSDNIFRDHEKLRYFRSLSLENQEKWKADSRENYEIKHLNFLKKYDLEGDLCYYSVNDFVVNLDTKFSDDDHEFVAELGIF